MPGQQSADESAIREQIDSLVAAIRGADLEGVRALYAADVVSFDAGPPLRAVGISAKTANWVMAFELFQPPLGYEICDLAVTVGGDVAFAHGLARLSGTMKSGARWDGSWVRVTVGFMRIDGTWLIAHDHVSVPVELESGRGLMNLEP
jgi:ketosteroid isomerase-like protein